MRNANPLHLVAPGTRRRRGRRRGPVADADRPDLGLKLLDQRVKRQRAVVHRALRREADDRAPEGGNQLLVREAAGGEREARSDGGARPSLPPISGVLREFLPRRDRLPVIGFARVWPMVVVSLEGNLSRRLPLLHPALVAQDERVRLVLQARACTLCSAT